MGGMLAGVALGIFFLALVTTSLPWLIVGIAVFGLALLTG